jgi:uncharacterized membrane protein YkvA (DUF1232 family)
MIKTARIARTTLVESNDNVAVASYNRARESTRNAPRCQYSMSGCFGTLTLLGGRVIKNHWCRQPALTWRQTVVKLNKVHLRRPSDSRRFKSMAINPTGAIKNLGWGRFFHLLVHLPSFVKLFLRLMKDPRVNLAPKLVVLGVLAYVVLPIDLVPDFIPGLGQADDVAVILAGLKLFLRLCPPAVVQEHVKSIAAGK